MNPHPLAHIRYRQKRSNPDETIEYESYSYHVPRVGDQVEAGRPDDDARWINGYVKEVVWREHQGDVLVYVG